MNNYCDRTELYHEVEIFHLIEGKGPTYEEEVGAIIPKDVCCECGTKLNRDAMEQQILIKYSCPRCKHYEIYDVADNWRLVEIDKTTIG